MITAFRVRARSILRYQSLLILAILIVSVAWTGISWSLDLPDLVMTSVSSPTTGVPGGPFTITSTVTNQGTGSAGCFFVGIYLSPDATITTDDMLLTYRFVSDLAAGASNTADIVSGLPDNIAAGTYYIGAIADIGLGGYWVAETDETNNILFGNQLTVTGSPIVPDLVMTSVSSPTTGVPGGPFTITSTVTNQGTGNAGGFVVGIYLSPDAAITTDDMLLTFRIVTGLAAGASDTADIVSSLPDNIAAGTYYLGAIADYYADYSVAESNETNNSLFGNLLTVTVAGNPVGPDLVITSVLSPTTGVPGGPFTITSTVTNQGTASAGGFFVGIYLSPDAAITTDDMLLTYRFVSDLAAGASNTADIVSGLPDNIAAGTYYIGAMADIGLGGYSVAETDETNNILLGNQLTVTGDPVGPDLVMTSVSSPTTGVPGGPFTITSTVTNQGTGSAGGFFVGIYLSPDAAITTDDMLLTYRFVSDLAGGISNTADIVSSLPDNIAAGIYYLGAIADVGLGGYSVAESNETNNILAGNSIFIGNDTIPPTGSIVINADAEASNAVEVTLTLSAVDTQSGVSQMQFSDDNVTWTTPEPHAITKIWTLSTGDGSKSVWVKFKDVAGNWSVAYNDAIVLDTTPPTVTISSPASGTTSTTTPVLSYTVSDGTVVVKVDSGVVAKVSGDNLDLVSQGTHTVRVEATDIAGNTGFAEVSFTITGTVSPFVSIDDPSLPILGSFVPLSGGRELDVTIDIATNTGATAGPVSYPTATTWTCTVTGLATGLNQITATATDALGNSGVAMIKVSPGVVGLWHMDGNWDDQSGSGNNGIAYSGATFSSALQMGTGAGSFDGSDDMVVAGSCLLPSISDSFAVAFWVNPTATRAITTEQDSGYLGGISGQRYAVAPCNGGYTESGAGVSVGTNGISVFELGASYVPSLLVYDATISGWNHVVLVYENKQPKLYLNGQLVRTGLTSPRAAVHPSTLFGNVGSYGPYEGLLDEVIIYNRSLTAGDVQNIYQQMQMPTVIITSPSEGFTTDPTPVLLYSVNKGTVVVKVDGAIVSKASGDRLDHLSDGLHTVRVEATDAAVTIVEERAFTVDTIPPVVTISSPVSGATYTYRPDLVYTESDGNPLVKIDGAAAISIVPGSKLSAVPDGYHTVRVESTDTAGNTGFAEVSFTITGTVSPFVSIDSPSLPILGSTVPLSGGRELDATIAIATNTGATAGPISYPTATTWTCTVTGLAAGSNQITATATDALGNSGLAMVKVTPGVVGLWHMDNNWDDLSGSGNNGVAYSGATFSSAPQMGTGAGSFDGTDDQVVAGSGIIPTISNSFAIAFWANPTATRALTTEQQSGVSGTSNQRYAIAPCYGGLVDSCAGVSVGTNGISVFEHGGSYVPSLLVYDATISGWNHVVVVYEDKLPKLYLNGQLVRTGMPSLRAAVHPSTVFGNAGSYGPYEGLLDEVIIYNRSLTAGEVQTIYQQMQLPTVIISSPIEGPTNDSTPVLLYSVSKGTVVVKVDGAIVSKASGDRLDLLSDGLHTVRVEATDTAMNTIIEERVFTIDTVPPVVTISSPVTGMTYTDWPDLIYLVSEGTMTIKIDGIVTSLASGITLSMLADGPHTVRIDSTDAVLHTTSAEATFVLQGVFPKVIITAPTGFPTRNATPLLTYSTSDGTAVVKVDDVIVSKVSGNTLDTLAQGQHTVRVEATNAKGRMGYAEVTFTVDSLAPLTLSNVNTSSNTINTALGQSSSIFFAINDSATVMLKIIPEAQGTSGTPIYQASQICMGAGAYFFSWGGHAASGAVVPDEAYLYILEATDGTGNALYSPAAPTGTGTITTCSQSEGFDPSKNIPLIVTYAPAQSSRVNIAIAWGGQNFSILDAGPATQDGRTLIWDGRNPSGKLLDIGAKASCSVASLLGENHIVTTGDAVKIGELRTDPYMIHLSYGQFTRIKYTLSRDANVTLTLTSPSGTVITLFSNQSQIAGAQEIVWNGIDPADPAGRNVLATKEGDYMVSVQAVNPATGASSASKANLWIGY